MKARGAAAFVVATVSAVLAFCIPAAVQSERGRSVGGHAGPKSEHIPLPSTSKWESLNPSDPGDADFDDNEMYQGKPGLVALWRSEDSDAVVGQIEPRLAFRFAPGESPHPSIAGEHLQGRFVGTLNVRRPGNYSFDAAGAGSLRLLVNGQTVFEGPLSREPQGNGPSIALDFGPASLSADYTVDGSQPAALQTFWRREGDFREPISADSLRHNHSQTIPAIVEKTEQRTMGRRLFAELRCDACHAVDGGDDWLTSHREAPAPDLTNLGRRIKPGWLQRWLADPHFLQPAATMPALFHQSPQEQIDQYALLALLIGEPSSDSSAVDATLSQKGEAVFEQTGCIACHLKPDERPSEESDLRPLRGVGSKLTAAALRERIADPRKHFPGSRMPDFEFERENPAGLEALVAYLSQSRELVWESLAAGPSDDQILERWRAVGGDAPAEDPLKQLGRWVLDDKGCLSCHQFEGHTPEQNSAPTLKSVARRTAVDDGLRGCLAPDAGDVPRYAFSSEQRDALIAYLRHAAHGVGPSAPAPFQELNWKLEKLGCVACHERNSRGGDFSRRIAAFIPEGSDKTPLDLSPPSLTGVGEKLRPDWLHDVIVEGERARPWMALRMPVFDKAMTAGLPELLIRADGETPDLAPAEKEAASDEMLTAAQEMVGRNVFNCVSCHDVLGHQGTGTRGPDLAGVTRRIRRPWFQRWLLDPQRITAGTRMPSIFANGRSMAPQFLDGEPERQIDALWSYFSQGHDMKMPLLNAAWELPVAGGEDPHFQPTDRPVLLRGFMPAHAGLKAVALGFPQKVHFAFDTEKCLLAAAWTGDFAEVGGWVGPGRGSVEENSVKILGDILWTAPLATAVSLQRRDAPGERIETTPRYTGCWAGVKDAGFGYRLVGPGVDVHVEQRPAPIGETPSAFQQRFALSHLPADVGVKILAAELEPGETVQTDQGPIPEGEPVAAKGAQVWIQQGDDRWKIAADHPDAVWELSGPASTDDDRRAVRRLTLSLPPVETGGLSATLQYILEAK